MFAHSNNSDISVPTVTAAIILFAAAAVGFIMTLDQSTSAIKEVLSTDVIPSVEHSERNSYHALRRRARSRRLWSTFQSDLTGRQFRRYFRMSKDVFKLLCSQIEDIVGVATFKSEEYLDRTLSSPHVDPSNNIYFAHRNSTGGVISGEIKLAIVLRILGGGTYMDMAIIFDLSFNHTHKIFTDVIQKWIRHKSFYPINGVEYCSDETRMNDVALQFARASHGVINGCIGALDGWVVKIKKPTRADGVSSAKSFYSRKGYFAVNVQAIVDRKKKILFRSIMSRGAEHDSTAFKNSGLHKLLERKWKFMAEKGYYFIGDSAYSLKSFLLTPYDNAMHGTPEDNFNFFLSSLRISVECAFGVIDLRWGILWRSLKFSLMTNCAVIDACMRLHNFIVYNRQSVNIDIIDREIFDDECRLFYAVHPSCNEGVNGGEEDVRRDKDGQVSRGGRPSNAEKNTSNLGKSLRNMLRDEIERQGLIRPQTNYYRERNRMFIDE